MKRIFAMMLVLSLLLCGCGNKPAENTDQIGTAGVVTLGNVTVQVGGELNATQKTDLGTPIEVYEAPSCHYEGMDTVYTYDGYTLQTYRKGTVDILCMVILESAAYATDKGIRVGDTLDAVIAAYGECTEETKYYVTYVLSPSITLTFSLTDNTVTAIEYAEKAV